MNKQTRWSIDQSHSKISFKIRHLMIAHVNGEFKKYDASIFATGTDFTTAEIDVWIDPSSIETGDSDRDAHLKGAEFFDIENHKQISFTSNTIEKKEAEGMHELWGDLTMKGITKHIMLNVEFGGIANDVYGNEKAGFVVSGKINRSDWGLIWNSTMETGGLMVGDEIKIVCEIELINMRTKDEAMILENNTEIVNK